MPAPRKRSDCLLLDENLDSDAVANPLRELTEWTIHRHRDFLKPKTPDLDVVTFCGEKGWAVLTADEYRHSPDTVRAIVKYKVAVFRVIVRRSEPTQQVRLMARIVQAQGDILRLLQKYQAAFCAHIHSDGTATAVSFFDVDFSGFPESQQRTRRKYGHL